MSVFSRTADDTNPFDAGTTAVADITGDYTIDASHTRLGFSARHAMVTTVRGYFPSFEGTAKIDGDNPANSSVHLEMDASSVSTGSADRDAHLTSADFFDVENFPTWTFNSTNVERDGDDWSLTGDLSIKGVTRPVTIDFEQVGSAQDPFGNVRVGFEGTAVINRKDFGLTWNAGLETGGVLVSDKIKLQLDVSAIKNA